MLFTLQTLLPPPPYYFYPSVFLCFICSIILLFYPAVVIFVFVLSCFSSILLVMSPRLFVTIDFVPILAIFHYILWLISSGEGKSRMTFFWSCKIGSGLKRFLREMEDWYILICLTNMSDSQKPEVTGFFETEKKIWSFIYVWLIFTLFWLKLCNIA